MEGKKAVLTCESDANPPIFQYTWFDWNNQNLHHYDQMLRLDPVKIQHSGAYWCEAANQLGRAQSPPSTLTVYCKAPPFFFSEPPFSFPPSLPCPVGQPSQSLPATVPAPSSSFSQSLLTLQEGSVSGCPGLPDSLSSFWVPLCLSLSHP